MKQPSRKTRRKIGVAPDSFRRYMSINGYKGGIKKSDKKTEATRINAAKARFAMTVKRQREAERLAKAVEMDKAISEQVVGAGTKPDEQL